MGGVVVDQVLQSFKSNWLAVKRLKQLKQTKFHAFFLKHFYRKWEAEKGCLPR